MIQLEFHSERLFRGLALHRFNVHVEELKRELKPLLDEVYKIGYDRGIADYINNLRDEEKELENQINKSEGVKEENILSELTATLDNVVSSTPIENPIDSQ